MQPWHGARGVVAMRRLSLNARSTQAALAPAAPAARRHIRTGFFPEDADWMDPEGPLFAERLNMRWRYMDDPALRANVLERSNVGMGMLVLNRAQGLDLATVNDLYRRLRDLEVNTLKRVVGLAASEPGPFCKGLDPRELLLAAATAARSPDRRLPIFTRALLWHQQELSHLVADYRKPVMCHISGEARDAGAALACLSSFSGAHENSEVVVDACFSGLVPFGGLTYVLAGLPWGLGNFLALTGHRVRGPDLVYIGLVKHWMSPEALPFLELTSEKQLEVSEKDARALLDEHSLPVPPGLTETSSLASWMIPVIKDAFDFKHQSITQITDALGLAAKRGPSLQARRFAEECLEKMSRLCPLAAAVTLQLIGNSKRRIRETQAFRQSGPGSHGESGPLVEALRDELRAQQRLLRRADAAKGLHALCVGRPVTGLEWSERDVRKVTETDVEDILAAPRPEAGETADFAVLARPELPLSAHPRLRKYHPDYNPDTGLDHDPAWMAQEVKRWSPDLFAEQRNRAVEDLLGGRDPSAYGLSRWVRVEP